MTSVLLATPGANEGKWFVPAPLSIRLTATNGSVRARNRGNGLYRKELRQALWAIARYLATSHLSQEHALLRLDGQYGSGAILADLTGFAFVMRGKDYNVLDHPLVQTRLHLPPDQLQHRSESHLVRSLYDCPEVPVGPAGVKCRVVVATHPAGTQKSRVGVTRAGVVYELFFTTLPQQAFTASDVVELYLHRGAFEPALADEDLEQDPDRWCSYAAWGQECWQIVSQWVWNLRLELGHQLEPAPLRTTEFAAAIAPATELTADATARAPGYGPLTTATRLGKLVASRERTLLSSPMERSAVQQARRCTQPSSAPSMMAPCGYSTPPGSETVGSVPCVSSASGMATRR